MSFTAPRRVLRRHRLTQVGALGAGLALLLTACGGGSEPAESSSSAPAGSSSSPAEATTASPSAESSPTTSPSGSVGSTAAAGSSSGGAYVPASGEGPAQNVPKPEMPAVMKEETQEGAEAAVEYFWDAMYYLQQTGDASSLMEVSSNECIFCTHTASSMMNLYSSGGWFTGTKPEVHTIILRPGVEGFHFTQLMNFAAGTGFDQSGKIAEGGEADEVDRAPWMGESRFDDTSGHWVIRSMSFEGEGSGG